MRKAARAISMVALGLALASCGAQGATPEPVGPAPLPIPPHAAGVPFSAHILVDQFGYRPEATKVAVIRDPRQGHDAAQRFTPGAVYQLRDAADGSVVYSGKPTRWRNGRVDELSGDAGWWFDFSAHTTEGHYYVFDAEKGVRSAPFRIAGDVYAPVLKAAVRTFFYQRSGHAKRTPWAQECWADEAAYVGPGQDTEARDVTSKDDSSKVRDLSGGWFDAGDTNKYVTFAATPVHQLLSAFEDNPGAFGDDFDIPESGNGVPDLLDEVRWEIDWLKRMQFPDGSVALKVGTLEHTQGIRPGLDRSARYYVPACTSATIAAAGMFAHAALAFAAYDSMSGSASDLRERAELAWRNFHSRPRQTSCDDGEVKSGDADWDSQDQDAEAVVAAVYLFALTGAREYDDYVRAHYRQTRPWRDIGWSRYNPHQGEALLFYARHEKAHRGTSADIRAAKMADARSGHGIYGLEPGDDLYRAYLHPDQYHWGSNQVRANYGNTNMGAARLASGRQAAGYLERAESTVHYFHGVNPLAMVQLTNMYSLGATRSANEIFHSWFWHGTEWDSAKDSRCGPAPGFVPGGPNRNAVQDGVPESIAPPAGQPPQKSYRDWNTPWPEASWAVTEPGIYYQAAYIRLLSAFVK